MTFIIYIKKRFCAILKYNTQIKMNNRFAVYASIFAFESTYLQNLTLIFAFEFAFFQNFVKNRTQTHIVSRQIRFAINCLYMVHLQPHKHILFHIYHVLVDRFMVWSTQLRILGLFLMRLTVTISGNTVILTTTNFSLSKTGLTFFPEQKTRLLAFIII